MLSAGSIIVGYVVLVAVVGPWGLAVAAAHIGLMLLCVKR